MPKRTPDAAADEEKAKHAADRVGSSQSAHPRALLLLLVLAPCGACPGFPPLLLPSPDAAFRLLPPPWRNSCLRLMNSVAKWLISGLAPKYAEKYDRISDGSLRSRQK